MSRQQRRLRAEQRIALAMLRDPASPQYGYDLYSTAKVRSWTLYRTLDDWMDHGWLVDGWQGSPVKPRRFYTLTPRGIIAVGALVHHLPGQERGVV